MPACSFCKKMFKEPRGLIVFTFDGKAINYCSSKCRKNLSLNRDPRKVKWVKKDKERTMVVKESLNNNSETVSEK